MESNRNMWGSVKSSLCLLLFVFTVQCWERRYHKSHSRSFKHVQKGGAIKTNIVFFWYFVLLLRICNMFFLKLPFSA
jgi:hypothetical protein